MITLIGYALIDISKNACPLGGSGWRTFEVPIYKDEDKGYFLKGLCDAQGADILKRELVYFKKWQDLLQRLKKLEYHKIILADKTEITF
jgi:hypothetical protein